MNISNICIIGNDSRMDYVSQRFYDAGYEIVRNMEQINDSSVIVLAPLTDEKTIRDLIPRLRDNQQVYGGLVSNRLKYECHKLKIKCIDYLSVNDVIEKNAKLTAKGIVKKAVSMDAVIKESSCLVVGYGFCGKAISNELKQFGACVDIMVRRNDLKSEIESNGFGYINMLDRRNYKLLKYSYIFNTVPAMVLDQDIISQFSNNVMIFDIASAPGGTDFDYCKEKGIYAINYLGIPGKEYPKDAGNIIADMIIEELNY